MRLGVVLRGTGAHAAAGVGALCELSRRRIEPYAVCGMDAGAWPAALHIAGYDAKRLEGALAQAARMGGRLLVPSASARALLRGDKSALCGGAHMQRLLVAQAGERMLALCPRRGIFLCRAARGGHGVIFATQAYAQEPGDIVTTQASVSFAARAAMARPPFLAPVPWMGAPLLAQRDTAFACRQLLAMGAQRVLVIAPVPSPRRALDALELVELGERCWEESLPQRTGVLRVTMPEDAGALSFGKLAACAEAGRRTAEAELDRVFERMGMAFCRVLPFRRANG